MKNVSMWVLVLVLALVGSAIWHEVQLRHAAPGSNSRIKRASMKEAAPDVCERVASGANVVALCKAAG